MKSVHMRELRQKCRQGRVGGKSSIFSIFRKLVKTEENLHILTSGQLKYKNSSFGWNLCTCELRQKCRQGRGRENLQFFRFSKSCQNWRNILTSGQLKYKNSSFGWNLCTCVNWDKNVDTAGKGRIFNFFDFFKSFQNWRKSSYSHFRTTKI